MEPEEDARWAVNPYSFQHGVIQWVDSKVNAEVMVPVTQPMPQKGEPVNDSEGKACGFDEQLAFQLQCVSGEDKGVQVLFKSTSVGGKKAVGALATAIAAAAGRGDEAVIPVVLLETSSYQHKKYGKIYTPELSVVEWLTPAGEAADGAEADAPAEEEKPKGRQRRR